MRIALLWPIYYPDFSAGAVRCAAFAENLSILGNEVTVFTPAETIREHSIEKDLYEVRRIASYDTHTRTLGFGPAVFTSPLSLRTVQESVSQVSPDVVIASTPGPFLPLEGYFTARMRNIPFVLDFRDPWRLGQYLHAGRLRNLSKQAVEEFLCKRSDRILCVTSSLRDLVVREYGVDPARAVVTTNGAREADENALKPPKEFDVVFLGTPSAYKNLENMFKALVIARQSQPLRILFVGWVDNDYTRDLRTLAKELGLSEFAEFLPQIPNKNVRNVISKAKIGLESVGGTSSYTCAVASKNYEYLAAGLPIACLTEHKHGEMYSFIDNDVGFIANDCQSFAKKLVELLQDPERIRDMSRNALRHSRKFSWKSIVSEVYETQLKGVVGETS